MKKSLVYTLFLIFVFSTCKGQSKTDQQKDNSNSKSKDLITSQKPNPLLTVAGGKYIIDKTESVVTWKGSMVFASKGQHTGYVYISTGELAIEKNKLVGGTIEVDMNSIADERHDSNNNLVDHLKSPDFFDAKKFPLSMFAITKVESENSENTKVTGNLTIKGITHEVTFPTKIEIKDGIVNANGKVTIDRTQWDVRYKSKAFFANLADEAISDDIEFDMKIVAKNK